jgi:undecaprenyl diphosphate synthase
MDGNGRWAKLHRRNRILGHRRGVETVREIVTACCEAGIQVLTLYAFSEENWGRPATETAALMRILKRFLVSERGLLKKNEVKLRTIGDTSKLPKDVRKTLAETMLLTEHHRRMQLVLALSYGGRDEIVRAVREIARKAAAREIEPGTIDAATVADHLDTAGLPDPDLLIRTSGEMRTSNFLPWQLVYTEMIVTPVLWPDFDRTELAKALAEYARRERRFGLTGEQVARPQEGTSWRHVR